MTEVLTRLQFDIQKEVDRLGTVGASTGRGGIVATHAAKDSERVHSLFDEFETELQVLTYINSHNTSKYIRRGTLESNRHYIVWLFEVEAGNAGFKWEWGL